jgi:hypothetical protein
MRKVPRLPGHLFLKTRPAMLKIGKTKVLVGVIELLLGVIYSMMSHSVHHGIVFTLLLFIATQVVEIHLEMGKNRSKFRSFLDALRLGDPLTNHIGESIMVYLKKQYKSNGDHIEISDQDGIFIAYEQVWELLVDKQRSRGEAKAIHVDVVHSSDPSIWEQRSELTSALQKQGEFVRLGGKIARVLVGEESTPGPEYWRTADMMRKLNMEVRYYSRSSKLIDFSFNYDFLRVEDLNYVVKWYTDVAGERIATGQYSGKADVEVTDAWPRFFSHSKCFSKLEKPPESNGGHFVI